LAYEVKKNKEGIYIEINFTSEASFIAELERQYKIDENVIKFIVIRKED
jgi:small subunit ribosomal protein S6